MSNILIVEDEPKLAAVLADYLRQSDYRVHLIDTGETAVEWIRANQPDLVVLDIMLPKKDGMSICREVRGFSDVPIIMVTARVEEIDRLLGLELGADDYVCKPFSPREVVARIKAILRRSSPASTPVTSYRGIVIDTARYACTVEGAEIELTPVEFKILANLFDQPGRVLSRDQLMDRVYTDHRIVSYRTIDSHVKNLRRKISQAMTSEDGEHVIRSVYGVGYKLD
ncbi:MAG: response regulator [Gammaproteobacteria bacterium]|nr:response regulator [Gammaproteobacteria bacterium]